MSERKPCHACNAPTIRAPRQLVAGGPLRGFSFDRERVIQDAVAALSDEDLAKMPVKAPSETFNEWITRVRVELLAALLKRQEGV